MVGTYVFAGALKGGGGMMAATGAVRTLLIKTLE